MMAINDVMAPAEDDDLQRALNNKALQDLMTQQDAAGLPPEAPVDVPPEDVVRYTQPVKRPPTAEEEILRQAKFGGGGGPVAAQLPVLPDGGGLPALPALPGGGGSAFWKAPLAAGAMLGGQPSGLAGLIRKPAMPALPGRLPGVPGSSAVGNVLRKAPAPALSRGLPGVPGSKTVGKAVGKIPGVKKVAKGVGKLFGRR
jgi:hypothetical protein